ncbi:MAG: hypothetical protein ACP5D2_02515 [Candidatus Nanoarchaeia archaeon]
MINKKEGQLRKIFPVIVLVLLLVIVIVAAESINGETSTTQETQATEVPSETQTIEIQENTNVVEDNSEKTNSEINTETSATETESNPPEIIDLCENINCDASNLICTDGFNSTCENFCDSETGVCTSCNPGCEGHEQIMEDEIKNEIEEQNGSIQPEQNETIENEIEERNETTQFEQNKTIPPLTGEVIETELPQIDVQLIYPEKITRGEIIEVKAIVTNTGESQIKNVVINWQLNSEFEIISVEENCGNLNFGESCNAEITIKPSPSTSLGKNQIKILVSYEN